ASNSSGLGRIAPCRIQIRQGATIVQSQEDDGAECQSWSNRAFVNAIADIDDNGISLRYPQDKSGGLTQDRPLFVNDEEVVSYLEKFVEQLQLIDFDYLVENGK
ncbi:hypothetical protein RX395_09535, partial [Collinsella aerofaciens]|nr:hypothetical protein [Collinsella aerofaciens]